MVKLRDDIIDDIMRLVVETSQREGQVTENLAKAIASKVRNEWAGSRPYISHDKEAQIAARNERIYTAYWDENKRDIPQLARRFGLSVKQIRRIIF